MNVNFIIQEKKFKAEDGKELTYYVLSRNLFDGSVLEIPVKGDKCKLLLLSLSVENRK